MWRDTATFASGEQFQSRAASPIQSETTGSYASVMGIIRPVCAANLVLTGFTAAATLFALSHDTAAQTARAPNYSATAKDYSSDQVSLALPTAFQDAVSEMDSYRYLAEGWDGVGSVAAESSLVDAAISFIRAFPLDMAAPEASASADGSVSWFWNTDAVYATISFTRPGRFAFYATEKATGRKARGTGVLDNSVPQEFIDLIKVA